MSEAVIEYLESSLDIAWRKGDDELVLRSCIFCGRGAKMYVNIDMHGQHFGDFKCFSSHCQQKGGIVTLIAAIEGCGFREAAAKLFKLASGGKTRSPTLSSLAQLFSQLGSQVTQIQIEESVPLPEEYEPCYRDGKFFIPAYLKQRGISQASIKRWEIGYCRDGEYAGRVIIPVRCKGAQSFVARDITGTARRKYLNPPSAVNFLMGYDYIPSGAEIHCVEGPMDVIRWDSFGYFTVGYFGAGLRPTQVALLKAKSPSILWLVPDPDAYAKTVMAAAALSHQFPDVRVVKFPDTFGSDKADPGACPNRKVARRLVNAASQVKSELEGLAVNFAHLRDPYL